MKGKSITTRAGDGGFTRLADGTRVRKSHPRLEACGDLDELNSVLGMVCVHSPAPMRAFLRRIQGELFAIGAAAAGAPAQRWAAKVAAGVRGLERQAERLAAGMPPLSGFIIPGGNEASSWAHLARCTARRAERRAAAVLGRRPGEAECIRYLNRLSDYLFMLARRLEGRGRGKFPRRRLARRAGR